MTINVIIIDDIPLAQQELAHLLERHTDFQIVARCEDVLSALRKIREYKPDAIFLDIDIPGQNGFTLLDYLAPEEHHPLVVVVTGTPDREHLVRAYKEGVLDYLDKPVDENRFDKSIERIRTQLSSSDTEVPHYPDRMLDFIPCFFNNRIKFITPEDIQYVRSDARGIYVVCTDNEYYTELTLAAMESNTELFRCHRQYLISISQIDKLIPLENGLAEIKTKNGHKIPFSRKYYALFKKWFLNTPKPESRTLEQEVEHMAVYLSNELSRFGINEFDTGIQTRFGEQYGLKVECEQNQDATLSLQLPFKHK